MQPTAAAQYFFEDYYRHLTAPLLINPAERGTRQRPTTGQGVITHRLDALEDRKAKHQAFFGKLSEKANFYWFDHPYLNDRQYKLGKVVQRLQEEKSYAGFFAKL